MYIRTDTRKSMGAWRKFIDVAMAINGSLCYYEVVVDRNHIIPFNAFGEDDADEPIHYVHPIDVRLHLTDKETTSD